MVVEFRLMAGMIMIMPSVVAAVLMVMHVGAGTVRVLVEMFVQMLVAVSMTVIMAVLRVSVGMLVGMLVGVRVAMVMRVQMFVLVFSFHNQSSCSSGCRNPS